MLFSEMLDRGQDGATAIVDSHGSVSYGEFRTAVAGFAAHLHDMGLAKGAEAIDDVQVLPQGQLPRGYDASKAACVNG